MKSRLSNWREETNLLEAITGKMTDKEALKKVEVRKDIDNKVEINPKLSEAVKEIGGELLEVTELSDIEAAVEYFYEEGINEEGIDLIIEEVGLDDFVDFVDDSAELLTEERAARKMNVRTLKATQKKAAEIKASKKDVVKRGTPADTVARARAERALKKRKLAKPAPKKEAPKPVAKKDFDGDGKKETPKQEHRGVRNKKIAQAVKKVKPVQPKKRGPASKEGLRAKIKSAYEAGVKRHRKATQPVRVFHKGMKAGAKATVKFAGKAKKALVGEEVGVSSAAAMAKARKEAELRKKEQEAVDKEKKALKKESASYETVKKGEVLSALKRDNPRKKKPLSVADRDKIADKVVKDKGDTSKSDDRYAYESFQQEAIERQAKDRKKLSQPHSVSGSRRDHSHDVDSALTDYVPRKGKGRVRPASKKEMRTSAMRDAGIKVEGFSNWRNDLEEAKVDKGKSDAEKAEARNKRNTPAGKDRKFDTSVFITRKPGESLSSARARKRAEAHKKQQKAARAAKSKERATGNLKKYDADGDGKVRVIDAGYKPQGQLIEKRDKAFDNVVGKLRKKYGKDAVLTKDSPKPKPQRRPEPKPDTRTPEQKKRDQEEANIDAQYGGRANRLAGRGLGT